MRRAIAVAIIICWPDTAWAHGSIPGMAGFYWGLLHPFTPALQLLMLLALAVQQRLPDGEKLLKAFAAASLIGLAVASAAPGRNPEPLLLLMAICCGLLAAGAIAIGRSKLWVVGVFAGLPSGYASMPDSGPFAAMAFTAGGALLGSFLTIVIVAGSKAELCQKLKWAWLPIAVRIVGSWITAVALLLGALQFRTAT